MYSKIIILLAALFSFTACDSKIGEAPPETPVQEFNATQCLSRLNPVVTAFFNGEATPQQITQSWDCVITAAEAFKRYVRGQDSTQYTSAEIATFLEKNFLDPEQGQKISPALQLEFMKVKQLIIGGRTDVISLSEIDLITGFMQQLKQISLDLGPHMKILAMNWSVSNLSNMEKEIRQFENANEVIQVSARQLATMIEKNGQSYELSDFMTLIKETEKFFGESWGFTNKLAQYMPVVKKVKKALAGGREDKISAQEWRRFSVLGSRGYIQYLRYYYFIQSVPQTGTGYRLSYLARTVEDLLSVFQELVTDKPEGVVSSDELYELLRTIELVNSDFRVSERLITEIMKVKQLFFGGKSDSLASSDFENARLKVHRVKALIERFMPYYAIYGGDWDPSFYEDEEAKKIFQEAQVVLESSLAEAGSLFEGSYDLNNITRLTRELENLYGINLEASSVSDIDDYLPLIIDLKNMVLGGDDSDVKKDQWTSLLTYTARGYSFYLYHHYFLKDKDHEDSATQQSWSNWVELGINLGQELTLATPRERFSKRDLTKIARHLGRLDMLPDGISKDSIGLIVDLAVNRLLVEPSRRLKGYEPDALNADSFEVLRTEFFIWHETKTWLANLVRRSGSQSPRELYSKLREARQDNSGPRKAARAQGLEELSLSVDSPVQMVFDYKERLVLTNGALPQYDAKSLELLNLQRTISRFLLRSFVGDTRRINNYQGATLKELERAFSALRPLLIDMDLIDSSSTGFASSRFREANMFTPHGNGDQFMSHAEVTDIAGLIWSGAKIHDLFKKDLARTCLNGRWNGSKRTQIYLGCALKVYYEKAKSAMSSAAIYVKYTEIAPVEKWNDYMVNITKAAGYIPNKQGLITFGDLSLVPHVLQYVEMIYMRFDPDKNGVLHTQEALNAYPAFKGIIYELARKQLSDGTLKEEHLVDLFAYILRYGKPPETVPEKLHFVTTWRGRPSTWNIQADRNKLATILGYIADQIAARKKN